QAEDGIRDRNVTGVQTCALPILRPVVTGTPTPATGSTVGCSSTRVHGVPTAVPNTPNYRTRHHVPSKSRLPVKCVTRVVDTVPGPPAPRSSGSPERLEWFDEGRERVQQPRNNRGVPWLRWTGG